MCRSKWNMLEVGEQKAESFSADKTYKRKGVEVEVWLEDGWERVYLTYKGKVAVLSRESRDIGRDWDERMKKKIVYVWGETAYENLTQVLPEFKRQVDEGLWNYQSREAIPDWYYAESFGAEAIPIRHSRRLNGYYGIKGYEDASEDGFTYRIYRSPGTNDWFRAMVYDDNSLRDNFAKPTSRRLNPSGKMTISNDPASLLIGAFPKLEDAKRALVFRMIQDGNYHQMITDGNLKWLLKDYYAESFSAEDDMIICEGCNMERYSDVDFTIDNAREDVLDDGDVLCDYCWASHDKYVENAESFAATTGKRMYCPACQTNRTWMTGYKKREMDYTKGERPQDFRFYVCNTCEYAYDPKTSLEIKNWKIKYYGAESINSFSPARLVVLGASIGVALGLYNTRRD